MNAILMELHEEIVTELQYKLEQLERENDDLNEEIDDNKQEYKETIEDLEKKIVDTLNDKKVRIEYDEGDEAYNYAIEVCVCYVEEYGVDCVIARPCHVYGPHFTESDNRVYAQFIRNVLDGNDIVMKSTGVQFRSWCYVFILFW